MSQYSDNTYLWQGELIEDENMADKVRSLSASIPEGLVQRLNVDRIVAAADAVAQRLLSGECEELERDLMETGLTESDAAASMKEAGEIMAASYLKPKIEHELGRSRPFRMRRIDAGSDVFEGWQPLGTVLHIAPGNAPTAGALSVVESLMCGNVNILKDTSRNGFFSLRILAMLGEQCSDIKPLLYGFRVSSSNDTIMNRLYGSADGVAVWGGNETIEAVRQKVLPGVRLIEWGHHISFAYFTEPVIDDDASVEALAHDMCKMEQQACSSPQILYIDSDDFDVVTRAGEALGRQLEQVSPEYPAPDITIQEQAEVTAVTQMVKLQKPYGDAEVMEDENFQWRLLLEDNPQLKASPLYRTLWVKPMPQKNLVEELLPYRRLLQTATVGCTDEELPGLTHRLMRAGITRIVKPGKVFASYPGEPHDGVPALTRYCKRVDVQGMGERLAGVMEINELLPRCEPDAPEDRPITDKGYFLDSDPPDVTQLYVKSGGSSNKPKLSGYTYHDYNQQMELGADGLFAAGFDVHHDRCMNLFYAGHLYGGFLSIFTILEKLGGVQVPMTAVDDLDYVASTIVDQNVNTLCGMPNYLIRLFQEQEEILRPYSGVKKIFYGGEMFNPEQVAHLRDAFGVERVRSLVYGSNDIGPMGFACEHCDSGVHHLFTDAQVLEIFKINADEPVDEGETGRLLFTPLFREGQDITRYEIGDLGRWMEGECPCGRTAPRFQLRGRYGDIFKAGGSFLNYREFNHYLTEGCGYDGRIQLKIDYANDGKEHLVVRLDERSRTDAEEARETLLTNYHDLNEVVVQEPLVHLDVELVDDDTFERTANSDKLVAVIDNRELAQ